MEQERLLKLAEERFMEFTEKVKSMQARTEDLLFRSQRWSNAVKAKQTFRDNMFEDDLQLLRRAVRTFITDTGNLPTLMGWIERECHFDPNPRTLDKARTLAKICSAFEKLLDAVCEQCRHLHQYVPNPDIKIEAWYIVQDLEALHDKAKGFPFFISSRIMLKIATPEKPSPGPQLPGRPPAQQAPPPPKGPPPPQPPQPKKPSGQGPQGSGPPA